MIAVPAAATRKYQTAALIAAFAAAVCLRMPQIMTQGRFWAEEGKEFFFNAWTMPPVQALFLSYAGYLNLAANASALAARWLLPLAVAPYLTIMVGLAVQLFAPLLLLTARDSWLQPVPVRIAAILLLLLIPGSEEVWLQTLHCQFHLALCCGIILSLASAPGRGALWRYVVLFLAPLCGPVAIALLPLFAIRTVIERARARLWQATALGAGAALQLGLFFHPVSGRGYRLDPVTLLSVVTIRHIYVPFLGVSHAKILAPLIRARIESGHMPHVAMLLPIGIFGSLLVATLRQCRASAFWFLAAGGLLAGASYFGAIGGAIALVAAQGGDRYTFAPQALFALSVLTLAATAQRVTALLALGAVLWLLVVGGANYFHPWGVIAKGPSWRREVAAWQADPRHELQLWPRGWSFTLEPR